MFLKKGISKVSKDSWKNSGESGGLNHVYRQKDNRTLAGKRPVQIKSPLIQIQYLQEVPGFHSAGHIRLLFQHFSTLAGCHYY